MIDSVTRATAEPPWLEAARLDLGVSETPGARDNSTIVAYYRDAGHSDVVHDSIAWCAAFVGAMLERSGIASARSLRARAYLDWGEAIDAPRPGCVVVLWRGSRDGEQGHVGFYVGEQNGRMLVLGGNQSDAVTIAAFPRSQVLGLRWPEVDDIGDLDDARSKDLDTPGGGDVFEIALAHILTMEGGWSDDPYDPGGPTNRGITLAELARWENLPVTADTMPGLRQRLRTIDTAFVHRIYRANYWVPGRCDDLPPALALLHFDAAVNQGLARAAQFLQSALSVDVDGEIGPVTLAAAHAADLSSVVARYCNLRREHYRGLAHFWRFGRGWLNRVDATARVAADLIERPHSTSSHPPEKEQRPMSTTPSSTSAGSPSSGKWWGHSITIWGVAVTTLTAVLPLVARAFGVDLPAQLVQDLGAQLTAFVQAFAGLAGVIITVIGRVRATQPLNLNTKSPPPLRARDWRNE